MNDKEQKREVIKDITAILYKQEGNKLILRDVYVINDEDEAIVSLEIIHYNFDKPDVTIAWTGWDNEEWNTQGLEDFELEVLIKILSAIQKQISETTGK